MRQHHRVQKPGRDLAVPIGAHDKSGLPDDNKAHYPRRYLLEREEQERQQHKRIAREQAQQHCRLSEFICHGVNDLAEVAYHVEAARDISIGRVGYPGQREQRRGFPEVLFYAVGINEKRDKNKPEHGKHIRYGDAVFPDTAFLGLFVHTCRPLFSSI